MSDKPEIKKIVLNLGDKNISLTPEQAKQLRDVLDELFGQKVYGSPIIIEHYPYWHWHHQPYWISETGSGEGIYTNDNNTLCLDLSQ